ncbi:uncharacterized protein EV422DRAFT_500579 [Fimicolochytrium jonesii]|uniref:uncharacterized protein n=1 Tax=Fimicolochytrium jonesii TaxID=1396493 RepID=UPI0022FE087E|nr:uncharacterized protein EV422DRAFT_500579 [Fimicolochytrium jonesii]KAI8816897.1 hypothetical protein EV422DRAFT_500579 [Fimicolochytrium jonesii]
MVYTLLVNVKVKPERTDSVRTLLAKASSVYTQDKGTLSWFVMQSAKTPTEFAIVERYESKADLQTHIKNPFYAEFGKTVGPWLDGELNIQHFEEISRL